MLPRFTSRGPTGSVTDFSGSSTRLSPPFKNSPELWSVARDNLRIYTMARFPFAVYYRLHDDELRILVVKHHKRHPDYWRHCLEE